jgi:hypothetical protein
MFLRGFYACEQVIASMERIAPRGVSVRQFLTPVGWVKSQKAIFSETGPRFSAYKIAKKQVGFLYRNVSSAKRSSQVEKSCHQEENRRRRR